jgi:hypothetical protein
MEGTMIVKTYRANAQKQFLAAIGERITEFGFNPKVSGQSFYRKVEGGKWAFHISFIPHKEDLDLTADVAVRINQIEDLVNKYDMKRNEKEKRMSFTFGIELGNLSINRPKRWIISDEAEIPSICDQVIEYFRLVGLPLLQVHSSITAAHRILVSNDRISLLLCPIIGSRSMRAIASSYLLGFAEEVRTLANQYETELTQIGDLHLKDFRNLCEALSPKR